MDLTTVIDCTGQAFGTFPIPPGVLMAGYATGTGPVPWTDPQFASHPGAVRIDQWPAQTSRGETADVLDVEPHAVAVEVVPARIEVMRNAWRSNARPGQRWPAVYVEASEETPVANALTASGIVLPVPFFLTEPMTLQAATNLLNNSGGNFPYIGIQYEFHADHDVSVVSTAWLANVSGKPAPPAQGLGTQAGWRHCLKCTSLFYGPQQAQSHCAAGGAHDGSQSHDFTLGFFE